MTKKKILLIEDNKNLLMNLKTFLEIEKYEVKTETEGKSGITSAKEWKPDLIICDINLPLKDGYEVLSSLSRDEVTKLIPFIFLTSKVEREELRKGMQLGADDYIFKPFDLDDLLNSIKTRIEKSSFRNQAPAAGKENMIYEMDDKILVNTGGKMLLFAVKDIKWMKAENPYIRLKLSDGKYSLQRQTLNEWESKLPKKFFLRIHRSTIINMEYITKIEKMNNTSYIIRVKDESEPFVISKRYSVKIRDHFSR